MKTKFHISLPCTDVVKTKNFYQNVINAHVGRHSENWVDINFFDHQVTFTKAGKFNFNNPNYIFEGKILPSFHFGIIIDKDLWEDCFKTINDKDLEIVSPTNFLEGKLGEHKSFFIKDPNGYMIEFKCFNDGEAVFK